ncbi:MAG: hypothetical protein ACI8ZM_003132 [Crocinitomix sp.]|jgi:uncharacterized protein YxjI
MKYQIGEKFLSYGEEFPITDVSGNIIYLVYPETFSSGHKFSFMDAKKNKLGYIVQNLNSWEPRYKIILAGVYFGEVIREGSGFKFREKFRLNICKSEFYIVKRYSWHNEYRFIRNGEVVGKASKNSLNWKDGYVVEFFDLQDHLALLSTCIAIDQVLHDIGR